MMTIIIDARKSLNGDDSTSRSDYFTCCMRIGFLKSTQSSLRYIKSEIIKFKALLEHPHLYLLKKCTCYTVRHI